MLFLRCSKKSVGQESSSSTIEIHVQSRIMLDSNLWMTENLNMNIPDSYCPKNDSTLCQRYGRLYTWEAAKKGCDILGDGWRLPTNGEWQTLAGFYGGV